MLREIQVKLNRLDSSPEFSRWLNDIHAELIKAFRITEGRLDELWIKLAQDLVCFFICHVVFSDLSYIVLPFLIEGCPQFMWLLSYRLFRFLKLIWLVLFLDLDVLIVLWLSRFDWHAVTI